MYQEPKRQVYKDAEEVIDAVMEQIGMRWTFSMISRELIEHFPDINYATRRFIINAAKKKIKQLFNIEPEDYKGKQIAFYEAVIRGETVKMNDKLKAAERLDDLLGLKNLRGTDPQQLAAKVIEFKKKAMASSGGQDNGGSTNEGDGESKAVELQQTTDTVGGASGGSENTSKDQEANTQEAKSPDDKEDATVGVIEEPLIQQPDTAISKDVDIPQEILDALELDSLESPQKLYKDKAKDGQ